MNVKPTIEIIRAIAEDAKRLGRELDRRADTMEREQLFDCASESIDSIVNFVSNARLSLLVVRPIREYEREKINKERASNDSAS